MHAKELFRTKLQQKSLYFPNTPRIWSKAHLVPITNKLGNLETWYRIKSKTPVVDLPLAAGVPEKLAKLNIIGLDMLRKYQALTQGVTLYFDRPQPVTYGTGRVCYSSWRLQCENLLSSHSRKAWTCPSCNDCVVLGNEAVKNLAWITTNSGAVLIQFVLL